MCLQGPALTCDQTLLGFALMIQLDGAVQSVYPLVVPLVSIGPQPVKALPKPQRLRLTTIAFNAATLAHPWPPSPTWVCPTPTASNTRSGKLYCATACLRSPSNRTQRAWLSTSQLSRYVILDLRVLQCQIRVHSL